MTVNTQRHARLRELLLSLREDVVKRVDGLEITLKELIGDRAGANDDDEHDPEGVTLSTEWSRLSGLAQRARTELTEVDAALERWETGDYGVCTKCGKDIPDERLEVRPFAEHCVPCASRRR